MSFNKIKIKQIDVDLSGSVYSFGTGFFVQTGVLPEISGNFLSKQDFLNSGVALSTNQDIPGTKNFLSKPTFSGAHFAVISESMLLTGSQEISGTKSFRGTVNFYNTVDFFTRPVLSGDGLARLSETVWLSGGAQSITGAKTFISNISAPAFSGSGIFSSSNKFAIATNAAGNSVTLNIPVGTETYAFTSGEFSPAGTTSIRNLGSPTIRWKEIFCANAVINTSDKNLKKDISEIPEEWLDAWAKVSYKKYKFKNQQLGQDKWNIGLIAQEIFEIFEKAGLNAVEIGLVRYDEIDENSKNDPYYAGLSGIWSVIPDACQFLEAAVVRRFIEKIENIY